MLQDRIIITGATGGVFPRLEITDLVKIEDQFSLFIQAMITMQADATTKDSSHFSIGGIHGLPLRPWGDSYPNGPVNGDPTKKNWNGYCTHGSVLFPTWHRPYVALYEQTLCSHAQEIAKGYPDKARWTNAAMKLRMPYWDWVKRPVPPPEVIELETLSILMPDGNKASVKNPLISYHFNGAEKDFPDPPGSQKRWSTFPKTVRHPDDASPVEALKHVLTATADQLRDHVNRLWRVGSWDDFSNHTASGIDKNKSNSLEAIHDTVHIIVGAGGHMNDPWVAGFDPIFFLHHSNVDRILALWQDRHPKTFVSPGSAQKGTWSIPVDAIIDEKTPLTPFWSGDGPDNYWASAAARSWELLGYTYPDFQGPALPSNVTNPVQKPWAPGHIAPTEHAAYIGPSVGLGHSGTFVDPINGFLDWTARVHCKKFELGESFAVHLFLKPPPEDPTEWIGADGYVGSHYVFSNSGFAECANCVDRRESINEGFIHINAAIAKFSDLTSYDAEIVVPYLKGALEWRVQKADLRTPIPTADLTSLKIEIMSARLHQAGPFSNSGAGVIESDVKMHPDITAGRQGGALV